MTDASGPGVPLGLAVRRAASLAARPAWVRRFARNRLGLLGAFGIAVFLAVGILAPYIEPRPYAEFDLAHRLVGPSTAHLLGTDQFGRDQLSRILYGARISLTVALAGTSIGTVVGMLLGALAGYIGGWVDEAVMRAMDIVLAFPQIVLAIAVAALLGPSIINVIWIIGLLIVPQFARVTRGSVIAVMGLEYVTAARTVGQHERAILFGHVLPNVLGPLVVLASLTIPNAIITEAALSFLGVGVQLPTPSWGNLLSGGNTFLLQAPWLTIFPGIAITLAVLSFNVVGDGLRDALDTSGGHE
ncbi:MAG TPA: ABC transporter permease [Candidatus Limnocylindrales bacterium]|nr:ABC transporter permease [Candidatus Limnocylindrales bacterium]